jgi:hypothetical protein
MSNWTINRLSGAEMSEIRETPSKPQGLFHDALDDVITTSKNWWLLLITGIAWVIIAILILRFDYCRDSHSFRCLLLRCGGE